MFGLLIPGMVTGAHLFSPPEDKRPRIGRSCARIPNAGYDWRQRFNGPIVPYCAKPFVRPQVRLGAERCVAKERKRWCLSRVQGGHAMLLSQLQKLVAGHKIRSHKSVVGRRTAAR